MFYVECYRTKFQLNRINTVGCQTKNVKKKVHKRTRESFRMVIWSDLNIGHNAFVQISVLYHRMKCQIYNFDNDRVITIRYFDPHVGNRKIYHIASVQTFV